MVIPEKVAAGTLVEVTNAKGKTILGKMSEIILNPSGTWIVDIENRDTGEVVFTLKVGSDD